MQILSIDVKPNNSGEIFTAVGVVQFGENEVAEIAIKSGSSTLFDVVLRQVVMEELRLHPAIPKMHDIIACQLRLEGFTKMTTWEFIVIGVQKFRP